MPRWSEAWFPEAFRGTMGELLLALKHNRTPANYGRDNLGTMLISIVNPNAEIREGFQYFSVTTNDGRSLSGFLVERDAQILVLRGLEGEDITVRQADVRLLTPMGRSVVWASSRAFMPGAWLWPGARLHARRWSAPPCCAGK